uniref:Uncharacterized protein n=1 Tax=Solanum tuberosum TaxID=4113 RepID=M1DL47_SOLTU
MMDENVKKEGDGQRQSVWVILQVQDSFCDQPSRFRDLEVDRLSGVDSRLGHWNITRNTYTTRRVTDLSAKPNFLCPFAPTLIGWNLGSFSEISNPLGDAPMLLVILSLVYHPTPNWNGYMLDNSTRFMQLGGSPRGTWIEEQCKDTNMQNGTKETAELKKGKPSDRQERLANRRRVNSTA